MRQMASTDLREVGFTELRPKGVVKQQFENVTSDTGGQATKRIVLSEGQEVSVELRKPGVRSHVSGRGVTRAFPEWTRLKGEVPQ